MERNTFDSIKIGLASPEMIRQWSHGEVTKSETINYRTQKPERDGLFCERIFGPTKDYECYCGKYKRSNGSTKNIRCEKCGVVLTKKKVRREWMGHIELACPVAHIWYSHHTPSRMATLLDISPKQLDKVIYYQAYIVTNPGNVDETGLYKGQVLEVKEYNTCEMKFQGRFKAGMGAESIKPLLQEMDLDALSTELKKQLEAANGQRKGHLIKRLEVVEAFRRSGNKPEWMVLDVVPILPPDLRTMVQLDGGRYATSDLNELYRKVIYINNRLKRFLHTFSPKVIVNNEKRQLQDAVDALIDNGKNGRAITGSNNRTLKSLSVQLSGKQGRFRQNLLGKRVDYSGRSVIVVGPSLKIYQCGLPKEMALELFKPFVMKRLVETGRVNNIKEAKKAVDRVKTDVWDALEIVIKEHPVLLNRAPTLHRLSVQAFEPVLVEGRAIKLHPLVCKAFNADFDGDQMPVHVPLSVEAQAEARYLMLSANNLLKPADGKAVTVPSQDMVLGSYYLTYSRAGEPGEQEEGKELAFRDFNEAKMAYFNGIIGLHTPIKVRVFKEVDGETQSGIIKCTLGRLIFNQAIPQNLHYVDRSNPDNTFALEIDHDKSRLGPKDKIGCDSGMLGKIIDRCIKYNGFGETTIMLDKIKAMGFEYSTRASFSISIADMIIPPKKAILVTETEKAVSKVARHFQKGEITEEERYSQVIKLWEKATDDVVDELKKTMSPYNPIQLMADSGARGSMKQIRQLSGIRGLMSAIGGRTIEIPVKSNFREGLNILEYFMAARGARKSLSDTALKTSNSGYLTRRLVDVAHEVIILEEDCGTDKGLIVRDIREKGQDKPIEGLAERLTGRYIAQDIVHPETGEILAENNTLIDEATANKIVGAGITEAFIRSPLTCRCKRGICAHCYGIDLAHSAPVVIGEAVGVIAAQSIGEPGTQLTMRNFHSGGVAGSDITQGLPRVEELFEARRPKNAAIASEYAGTIHIEEVKKMHTIHITRDDGLPESKPYTIPYDMKISVADGDHVEACQALTQGFLVPEDILRIKGIDAVYNYILTEVQKVYRQQNIEINDKHIEIITRQMTRKVHVEDAGDTELQAGTDIFKPQLYEAIEALEKRMADEGTDDLKVPEVSPILLGIKKAALQTESFLSAASFQETTKVLTDAAINGKIDYLNGLKENVIIGKLIPAGTGVERYSEMSVQNTNGVSDSLMDELETAVGRIEEHNAASRKDEEAEEDNELEAIISEETPNIYVEDDELTTESENLDNLNYGGNSSEDDN